MELKYIAIIHVFFSCLNICLVRKKMFQKKANYLSVQTSFEEWGLCNGAMEKSYMIVILAFYLDK